MQPSESGQPTLFSKSKRKSAKEVYLGKIAKKTLSQVPFTVKFFRIFQHTEVVVVNVKHKFDLESSKGICLLKIHHNSNECQHDILYVSKVKPINKIHAQSCNRNAIKLKKQSTRTMSTLFWCLSLYKAKLFQTFFVATVNILIQCTRPTFPEIQSFFLVLATFQGCFGGVRKIAPEENCPPVRVRVWFRIRVRIRAGGQFSSGAFFLEPFSRPLNLALN